MYSLRTLAATLFAISVISATPVVAQSEFGAANWFPEDTLMFVGVRDMEQTWEAAEKTAAGKMLSDKQLMSAMPDVNLLLEIVERSKKRIAEALDRPVDSLENPFGGHIGFGLWLPENMEAEDAEPLIGLVTGVTKRGLMMDYLNTGVRRLRDQYQDYQREEFSGHDIHVFDEPRPSEADANDAVDPFDPSALEDGPLSNAMIEEIVGDMFTTDALPPSMALCLTDDRFFVASTPAVLKEMMRGERSERTLARSEKFRGMRRHFEKVGPLQMYVDIPQLIKTVERFEGGDEEFERAKQMLGLDSFGPLYMHARTTDGPIEMEAELFQTLRGARQGLAAILTHENVNLEPPAYVSPLFSMHIAVAMQPLELLEEIERMVRATSPMAADQMRTALESVPVGEGPPLNLRSELIANLQAPMTINLGFEKPYAPGSMRLLIGWAHRSEESLRRVLGRLVEGVPLLLEREVAGRMVYDISMVNMTIAVDAKQMYIGSTPVVDAALAAGGSERILARDETYQRLMRGQQQRGWMLMYADARRYQEALIELLKIKPALMQGQMMDPTNAMLVAMLESSFPGVKPEDADKLRGLLDYQVPAAWIVSNEPDGVRARFISAELK